MLLGAMGGGGLFTWRNEALSVHRIARPCPRVCGSVGGTWCDQSDGLCLLASGEGSETESIHDASDLAVGGAVIFAFNI